MNSWDFYQCRIFLEERIRELPENMELVKAYVTLIEQKAQFDTAYFSQNAEVQKNWSDNHREMNNSWHKFQADVTQKQTESGQYVPAAVGYSNSSGSI